MPGRVMRARPRWALLTMTLALGAALGCKACDQPSTGASIEAAVSSASASTGAPLAPQIDPTPAKAAVAEYFTAMALKDCVAVMAVIKPVAYYTKESCKEDVDDFEEHHVSLLRIVSATQDGRDPQRILVTVVVRYGAKEREQIVGTARDGDAWKVEK